MISAQQAKLNNYKNTKLKLLKANAAIWFNKLCRFAYIQLCLSNSDFGKDIVPP